MQILRTFGFLAAALLAFSTQGMAAAPRVLASLIQPPGGLDCGRAAEKAQVVFDFQQPRSDVKQLSVFVNGKGVRESEISQDWPRVTVKRGLHVGRNTVEAVATGADGKSVSHKLTVLVNESPRKQEKDAAIVDCVGANVAAKDDDSDEAWGEEIDEDVDVVEDDVEYIADEVEYVYAPRYVYYPYPAFSYIVYQPAYYYPYPYYSYYYGRPYRHDRYYYNGGNYSRGRDRHRGDRHSDDQHRYQPNRPPTHERDSRRESAQLSPPRSERSSPPARTESHRTERGRGWR